MSANRVANSSRSGFGASNRSQFVRRTACRSTALTAMVDLDYGTGSQAHHPWWRTLQANTDWEALRDTHPIERALHVGNRARKVDSILVHHSPADAVNDSADGLAAIDHRIDGDAVTVVHRGEIRLAEIGGGEPFFRIDKGKERLSGGDELTAGDGEPDDEAIVGGTYRGVLQRALCQRERGAPGCDQRFAGLYR